MVSHIGLQKIEFNNHSNFNTHFQNVWMNIIYRIVSITRRDHPRIRSKYPQSNTLHISKPVDTHRITMVLMVLNLQSYLTNRKIFVEFKNTKSSLNKIVRSNSRHSFIYYLHTSKFAEQNSPLHNNNIWSVKSFEKRKALSNFFFLLRCCQRVFVKCAIYFRVEWSDEIPVMVIK